MIGAGWQGGTLAKQLAKAGHEVRVANRRGPQSLQEFAKQTGTIASTVEDAATNAELIMIALPYQGHPKPAKVPLQGPARLCDHCGCLELLPLLEGWANP